MAGASKAHKNKAPRQTLSTFGSNRSGALIALREHGTLVNALHQSRLVLYRGAYVSGIDLHLALLQKQVAYSLKA